MLAFLHRLGSLKGSHWASRVVTKTCVQNLSIMSSDVSSVSPCFFCNKVLSDSEVRARRDATNSNNESRRGCGKDHVMCIDNHSDPRTEGCLNTALMWPLLSEAACVPFLSFGGYDAVPLRIWGDVARVARTWTSRVWRTRNCLSLRSSGVCSTSSTLVKIQLMCHAQTAAIGKRVTPCSKRRSCPTPTVQWHRVLA